jgi:DNA-binding MarR family transcriptional regulator
LASQPQPRSGIACGNKNLLAHQTLVVSVLTMDLPQSKVRTVDDTQQMAEVFARQFGAVYLRFHRRDAKGPGLTAASRWVLQHLAMAGPLTVGELCAHLDRSQSVVSDIVSQLADKGLLERQEDLNDRRRKLVWLSPDGLLFLDRQRDVLSVELLQRAIGAMTPAERSALLQGVRALLAADDVAPLRPSVPTHQPPSAYIKETRRT